MLREIDLMAFRIQCLGCYERIIAQEADRGGSIPCDICGTTVAVPVDTEPDPRRRVKMSERLGQPPPPPRRKMSRRAKRMLLALLIGLPALFACCGGLGYVFRQRIADTVSGRGGPSDDPEIPQQWRRMKGDGFTMYAPVNGHKSEDRRIMVGEGFRTSREYQHADSSRSGFTTITVVHATLGNSLLKRSSHADLLAGIFVFSREARELGDRSVGGRDGKEYLETTIVGQHYYWIGKVGDRVYGLHFDCFGSRTDPAENRRLCDAWLRSIEITYPPDASSDPEADPWARNTRDTRWRP